MRRVINILIILFLLLTPSLSWGRKKYGTSSLPPVEQRSILRDIFLLTKEQQQMRWHYKARYYFRGTLDLTRRNIFVLFAYNRQYYIKGGRKIFTEDYGDMEYFYSGQYPRKVRCTYSINDNVPRGMLMEYFNTNIYSRMMQEAKFLSPLDSHNQRNYIYTVDSIRGSHVHFSYKARHRNSQLVSGTFIYDAKRRVITVFRFKGLYNLFLFDQTIYMGEKGNAKFFPKEMRMDYRFIYYGTLIKGSALSTNNYTIIEPFYRLPDRRKSKHDHNISSMFRLICDTTSVETSAEKMALYRTVPLTAYEDSTFFQNQEKTGSGVMGWLQSTNWAKKRTARKARQKTIQDSIQKAKYDSIEAVLKVKYNLKSVLTTKYKFDGNNPKYFENANDYMQGQQQSSFLTASDSIVDTSDTLPTPNDSLATASSNKSQEPSTLNPSPSTPQSSIYTPPLYLHPVEPMKLRSKKTGNFLRTLGQMSEYLFSNNKFKTAPRGYFEIKSPEFSYSDNDGVTWRQDFNFMHLFQSGRHIDIRGQAAYCFGLKEMNGKLISNFLLQPRKDQRILFEAGARRLVYNPLNAYKFDDVVKDSAGNAKDITFVDAYLDLTASREVLPGLHVSLGIGWHRRIPLHFSIQELREMHIRDYYTSMVPHITLTYNPCERYYWLNNRKVIVYSNKPTYTLNYERAIKGALGSTSQYERIEAMVTHDMKITPTLRLVWKIGGGTFTQRAHNDFIEYEYFNNGRIGYNWHDSRSGVFHLLDYKYYNQSNHYLRGHATLESPMLLLRCVNTYFLNAERIYGSILFADGIAPYIEVGYGVSTKWADVSYFVSYLKEQGFKVGFKFNLHIFD